MKKFFNRLSKKWFRSFHWKIANVKMQLEAILLYDFNFNVIEEGKIHRVDVKIRPWKTYVKMYCGRPGIVIGRKGELFYTIQNQLIDKLKTPVKLEIEEYAPFSHF